MDLKKPKVTQYSWLILGGLLFLGMWIGFPLLFPKDTDTPSNVSAIKSNHQLTNKGQEQMEVEISESDFLKIKTKRDSAVKKGVLLTSDDDLVKATIRYKGDIYNSEIRLKGDWTQHLEQETWSFRVKLTDNFTIDGMRKFSLQHPQTRNYAGEWLFQQMMKAKDIINLRYDFVNVNLVVDQGANKVTRELGYYALEEFFDKQLIENNRRREGIILKIDEDPIWRERRKLLNDGSGIAMEKFITVNKYKNLNILPFGANRVQGDENLFKQFEMGKSLLESYVNQKVLPSEVFDVEKLANYNAICNLLGADHSMILHNVRTYYNPINSKLEPIAFDGMGMTKSFYFPFYTYTEGDLEYIEAYGKALEDITTDFSINKILTWPGLAEVINNLTTAYPAYKWDKKILLHNRNMIRNTIYPTKSLNVFFIENTKDQITLNIENYARFPVEIDGLKLNSGRFIATTSGRIIIPSNSRQTVVFKANKDFQRLFVTKKKGKLNFNPIKDFAKIKVVAHTLGTSNLREEAILSWQPGSDAPMKSNVFKLSSDLSTFPFLMVDEANKIISCKQGYHEVTGMLVIPKGYTFKIYEGTELDFTDHSRFIISFSPIELLGSESKPIKFVSSSSRGRGLLVLNTEKTSILQHCIFENLAAPATPHWAESGAINFYDAPVNIYNCAFNNMRSEDALNIISTTFEIDNAVFSNSFSDAFDGDFVKGKISNTIFGNLGNDAIDISGSQIEVENVTIFKAGDKALSAGEKSTIVANKMVIRDSEIGIASKDQSTITLSNCLLEQNKLGFTAYQKKAEYGPGNILATSIELKNNENDYLIEKNSALTLNGIQAEVVNRVLDRMYGKEFGKKSER